MLILTMVTSADNLPGALLGSFSEGNANACKSNFLDLSDTSENDQHSMRKSTFKTPVNPSASLDINQSSLNTNLFVKLKTTSCSGRLDKGY